MTRTQTKNVIVNVSCFALVVVGLFILLTDGKSGQYELPRSVIHHEASLMDGGTAKFTLKLAGFSENVDMVSASDDMARIAKHEVEQKQTEGKILFAIVADGHDLYGHKVTVDMIDLEFSMDDLKQVDWTNFDGKKLLNLGRITREFTAGQKLISGYCDSNSGSSEVFCTEGMNH